MEFIKLVSQKCVRFKAKIYDFLLEMCYDVALETYFFSFFVNTLIH